MITTREELKEYCLRKLGFPVIEINVDDDQVEDRLDDTFQFYADYHYDAVERQYYRHQLIQDDIDNGWFPVPDALISVIRVMPLQYGAQALYPMGDPSLVYDFNATSPYNGSTPSGISGGTSDRAGGGNGAVDNIGYFLTMQNFEMITNLFVTDSSIRFNRHTNRVYIDMDWSKQVSVGDFIIAEGYATLNPEEYTDVYNDRWVKRYATAQIKMNWGANLIKYSGIALPGGVTLDGDKLFEAANVEIDKLEEEMQEKYELPPMMQLG